MAISSDNDTALQLVSAMARGHGALMRELEREIALHQLTQPQFGVLEILARRGPVPLHELGKELLVSGGNITCVVDNLEKAGLVVRTRDTQDRRVIKAALALVGRDGGHLRKPYLPMPQHEVEELATGLSLIDLSTERF